MMDKGYFDSSIEALVLASPEPLTGRKIAQVLDDATPSKIAKSVAQLNARYAESGTSFRIREIAGGYQYYILPEYVGFVEELFSRRRKLRLTRAALETVAIVAYRQPVSKGDVEHIRGVASDGVIRTLLEKQLITVTGRADTVGKPLQYGTTDEFLKFFGLARLEDMPKMSEIEEMISAETSRDQTELELQISADGEAVKLNIADGTFDPERRERLEDEYRAETSSDDASDMDVSEDEIEPDDAVYASDELDETEPAESESDPVGDFDEDIDDIADGPADAVRTLVLTRGAETTEGGIRIESTGSRIDKSVCEEEPVEEVNENK
ncbi:MAG: SMC-Scp complex subunit ScpB [candidate division Zixibacteria bacterium]|nr:SMC-Scp complex subunit ScpB [candidate division Zixibacteria bacterium]